MTTEIGDGLLAALMWERIAVTTDTTPVVGAETVSGFEIMMVMCEELFDVDGTGVSPFVWWWYDDNYWRVTDRSEDGTIEFRHHMNVNAYHLAGAIQHLANP